MQYDKTLTLDSGDSFPYYENLEDDEYTYGISVVWEERDSELKITPYSVQLEFDDDGSWIRFPIEPAELFPEQSQLSNDNLVHLLMLVPQTIDEAKLYSFERTEEEQGYRRTV